MSRRTLLAFLSVLLLGLLSPGIASAAGPYPPPAEGSGRVSDSRVQAGACVTFSGDGFAPLAPVTVRDNGVVVGTTHADAQGQFSFKVCFAADVKTGRHLLTGTGEGAGGGSLTVSAVVYVEGVSQSAAGVGTGLPRTGFFGAVPVVAGLLLLVAGSSLLLVRDTRRRQRRA
jgi:hypothetical protein